MDSRRSSIATNDESVSMYLSFDADDTLSGGSSKWQSALVTQSSQFLEVHSSKMEAHLEDKDLRRSVLMDLQQQIAIGETEQNSPLRPFDKSVLNRHNALSSTPSKDNQGIQPLNITNLEDKENTQPDEDVHAVGDNSTLSSSVDVTANTVKANTLKTEDGTEDADEVSVQEPSASKPGVSTVYPLSANVVLENITEVSNEGVSLLASPPPEKENLQAAFPHPDKENPQVTEVVNEVSELIAKAMKMTGDSIKQPPAKFMGETGKKRLSIGAGSTGGLPRPRRSYLPTASVETRTYSFKQRMSVVVKTTLNSPARKLSAGGVGRRSCLPVSKSKPGVTRKSMAAQSSRTTQKTIPNMTKPPVESAPLPTFTCKTCGANFRVKNLLDMHVRMHDLVENGPKSLKRLNSNPAGAGGSSSNNKNRCKYCDKNFALERALHIHLMQNCSKIPPGDKRKLEFTELNHEKKAQLPKIGVSSVVGQAASITQKTQHRMTMIPTRATPNTEQSMAPPSTKKVPKKTAHAGVYRTPTKSVPCHICKQSFKSILEFTNHSLTVHAKNQSQAPSARD